MPESSTYQLPPKSLKWESGQDDRYQTVYLPVTIWGTGKISWSFWPTEKAGQAVGGDSQIFACQLARCRSAEDAVLCPSDMMLCVISYWVLSGAKRRQIQQLRCCVLPAKLLKRRLEKSFIVRLFTYNRGKEMFIVTIDGIFLLFKNILK